MCHFEVAIVLWVGQRVSPKRGHQGLMAARYFRATAIRVSFGFRLISVLVWSDYSHLIRNCSVVLAGPLKF